MFEHLVLHTVRLFWKVTELLRSGTLLKEMGCWGVVLLETLLLGSTSFQLLLPEYAYSVASPPLTPAAMHAVSAAMPSMSSLP